MASEKPSAWAYADAKTCWESFVQYPTYIHPDTAVRVIATALDAAREYGNQEEMARDLAADVALRRDYGRKLGIYGDTDSTPCWDDILDAAREQGRNEREAEIVAWAEKQAAIVRADGGTILDAAWLAAYQQIGGDIKRGAGRKESANGN